VGEGSSDIRPLIRLASLATFSLMGRNEETGTFL
jgi:hypothetical protein